MSQIPVWIGSGKFEAHNSGWSSCKCHGRFVSRWTVSQMLVKDICETVKPSENGASKPSSTNIKRFAIGPDFSRPSDLGEKHPCGMLSRRPTRQRHACDHSNRTALDERRVILGGLTVRAVVGRKIEMWGKWMNRGLVV